MLEKEKAKVLSASNTNGLHITQNIPATLEYPSYIARTNVAAMLLEYFLLYRILYLSSKATHVRRRLKLIEKELFKTHGNGMSVDDNIVYIFRFVSVSGRGVHERVDLE